MEQPHSGPMAGRTVLVTGGTGGIGRATALGLATMGAHLAVTGRDRGRTEGAAGELRAAGGGQVDVFVADLSSQSEVRRLADEVLQSLSRIDVLVNNVGGYWTTRHVTADGLERTFALNHLAPFLLTNLLLDRLRVWLTNIIVFGLADWELDRGGPVARAQTPRDRLPAADFRFSQDENDDAIDEVAAGSSRIADWVPTLVDYLYVSVTNSTAVSPTDTMPLSVRAKLLMRVESVAAVITSVLVIARAVSTLK